MLFGFLVLNSFTKPLENGWTLVLAVQILDDMNETEVVGMQFVSMNECMNNLGYMKISMYIPSFFWAYEINQNFCQIGFTYDGWPQLMAFHFDHNKITHSK